jgi:hypothetical protein
MVTATTPRRIRRLEPTTWAALLYGAAVGFLLWALSPTLLGVAEPWDTEHRVYTLAMVGAGLALGLLNPRAPAAAYLGAWLGQVLALIVLPSFDNDWLLLGAISTAVGSLWFLLGVAVGIGVRSLLRRRRVA